MYGEAPKELYLSKEQKVKKMSEIDPNEETDKRSYIDGFQKGAEFGYNKAFVEADKNLKAIVTDFNKAKELIQGLIDSLEVIEAEQFLRNLER